MKGEEKRRRGGIEKKREKMIEGRRRVSVKVVNK